MKCIIIGLGTYGRVLVDELSALGHEVIAADNDASRVERVKDICDAVFHRVVALLKKLGVKHIYARANDYVHRNILQAFDIERILIPEERAARSLVRQMELGVRADLFRIDSKYCVFKFRIPERLIGLSPNDLHLYEEFHLKIIAIKKMKKVQNFIGIEYNDSEVVNVAKEDCILEADDELVCYGKESDFRTLCKLL